MLKNLDKDFKSYCNEQNLEINQNQIILILNLQKFFNKNHKSYLSKLFIKNDIKKGFYLFGDVGVGKTMILNFFFEKIKINKL